MIDQSNMTIVAPKKTEFSQRFQRKKGRSFQRLHQLFFFFILFILFQFGERSFQWSNFKTEKKGSHCEILSTSTPNQLSKLTSLDLKGCNLTELPASIKYATSITRLDVSENPALQTLPDELIHCNKLSILFASSCKGINSLPVVLGKMPSIDRLGWRSGSLTTIDSHALPPNLVHLILTDNNITALNDPLVFSKLSKIRKLMLSHNEIMSFGGKDGENISHMKSLELLRLGGNKLSKIPDELWNLPNLTWLTISGNPVMESFLKPSQVPYISLEDLQPLHQDLGKGASGQVSSYQYNDKEVAVKLIHGITSDGNSDDELAVYGAVGDGTSNRIVGCIALLNRTNEGKQGVVMDKLPSNLRDFALPPTIIEVTKDRWDFKSKLSGKFVLNALRDVSTAMLYLHHTVGVAHGDLYAHNMKVDPNSGRTFLLDFGASYFTGPFQTKTERLEVRAFGILVGELLELMVESETSLREKLTKLKQRCTDTKVTDRPSFDVILNEINSYH